LEVFQECQLADQLGRRHVLKLLDVVDVQGIAGVSVDGCDMRSRQRIRPAVETITSAGSGTAFGT